LERGSPLHSLTQTSTVPLIVAPPEEVSTREGSALLPRPFGRHAEQEPYNELESQGLPLLLANAQHIFRESFGRPGQKLLRFTLARTT